MLRFLWFVTFLVSVVVLDTTQGNVLKKMQSRSDSGNTNVVSSRYKRYSEKLNPCEPSPCGANAQCKHINDSPICSCLPDYVGSPPNCRPECVISADCPSNRACIGNKCNDPCLGTCGKNAICKITNHQPFCNCPPEHMGDPFIECQLLHARSSVVNPCEPSPCGSNSECKIINDTASCSCLPNFKGTPPNCDLMCTLNSECPSNRACIRNKCNDPCPGTCGEKAFCEVINHSPICSCPSGHMGDPFAKCVPTQATLQVVDLCRHSPCGHNSICKVVENKPVCSCLPNFKGSPPNCKLECVINSDCPQNTACINQKCQNPCTGACGPNAECDVVNYNPICSCPAGYSGDPFIGCGLIPNSLTVNPCQPSPCGSNAECKFVNNTPICSCLKDFKGSPPNCELECTAHSDCPPKLACINNKCNDPCLGACGEKAVCDVINHHSICSCPSGRTGNPFVRCQLLDARSLVVNPCKPSPCGPNSECKVINDTASCSCLTYFEGSPPNCELRCILNAECPAKSACIKSKCNDPCPGACGENALCDVKNHTPVCSCLPNHVGDPFDKCVPTQATSLVDNLCQPSPCGPNAECKVINNTPVCSCFANTKGSPPNCQLECAISADCPQNLACIKNKCHDPCPGTCGENAHCDVNRHTPVCSCPSGHSGDPLVKCFPKRLEETSSIVDPCQSSLCGPNSECKIFNNTTYCSCLTGFNGSPPDCELKCAQNSDCPKNRVCFKNKCDDPCIGLCGGKAVCKVINYIPICTCPSASTGNPFVECHILEARSSVVDPCQPSPCGANAKCEMVNNNAICKCIMGYSGNPFIGCQASEAHSSVVDLCKPSPCGANAKCEIVNNNAICKCTMGYSGDPFFGCQLISNSPAVNPCLPSPCGSNANCTLVNNNPACSCLAGFKGLPPNCELECTINSDCPLTHACIKNKCYDQCLGICGEKAVCEVTNHQTKCSCPPDHIGDPFAKCVHICKSQVTLLLNPVI